MDMIHKTHQSEEIKSNIREKDIYYGKLLFFFFSQGIKKIQMVD